jgi:ABC-2 type transport system ATP-binding protein
MGALNVEGLSFRYPGASDMALDDVTLAIPSDGIFGLLGPNGAGKTTLISILAGQLRGASGRISWGDESLEAFRRGRPRCLGLVPQEYAFYPMLTCAENLRFFGGVQGLAGARLTERIEAVTAFARIEAVLKRRAGRLSGGLKRRLNLAIGLLGEPEILLLDEPTVGVDPQSRNAILDAVEALASEGMAVLYTTHYMEEAERLCDRVGILDEGVLKAEGTRRELISLVGEHDRLRIDARGDLPAAATATLGVPGVSEAVPRDGGLDVLAPDVRSSLAEIVRAIDGTGTDITSMEVHEPNLEAVFLHLTGKALRDEE